MGTVEPREVFPYLRGRAPGQGMVFGLSVLNRVYNLRLEIERN